MGLFGASHGHRRRRSEERGATAVEAAVVTPVVMALLVGIMEMGFLFKDYLSAVGSVRAGVRIASSNPRNATFAQKSADQVAKTAGAMNLNDVQEMWVYKANPATAAQASQNKPFGRSDFNDCATCVKFSWNASTRNFDVQSETWFSTDQNTCASTSSAGPPDRIGVYLKIRHNAFTGLVFNTINISEASIMTLETTSFAAGCV